MILSDREIKDAILKKEIVIDPLPKEEQYTTTALDLTLGDDLKEMKTIEELEKELVALSPLSVEGVMWRLQCVNLSELKNIVKLMQKYTKPIPRQADGSYLMPPKKLVMGITKEKIGLPIGSKIAARVEGRSTLARLGLLVHLTAPTIHAGWKGRIALEMYNLGEYPLCLTPEKDRICQLVFERVGRTPQGVLKTKFLDQKGV